MLPENVGVGLRQRWLLVLQEVAACAIVRPWLISLRRIHEDQREEKS